MTDLTFAVSIPQGQYVQEDGTLDVEACMEIAVAAEELGYDHVLAPDHVFVPDYWGKVISDYWLEPFSLLSFVAARTKRIELVLSVLVVPYRQPFGVAKSAVTLDQLSGGRFALGITPGYLEEEFEAFGLPIKKRGAMTNEFTRIIIELMTEEVASYAGQFYSFKDVKFTPRPVQKPHVPIWVAGSSSAAMRRVAEFGQVWHPLNFNAIDNAYARGYDEDVSNKRLPTGGTTPAELKQGISDIRRMADEIGRDLNDLKVVVMNSMPADQSKIVDHLAPYIEAGATGFSLGALGTTNTERIDFLERFQSEIVPKLG
jgi:probable F420-dependent oxidoreductase